MKGPFKLKQKVKVTGTVVGTGDYMWIEIDDYVGGMNLCRVRVHPNAITPVECACKPFKALSNLTRALARNRRAPILVKARRQAESLLDKIED